MLFHVCWHINNKKKIHIINDRTHLTKLIPEFFLEEVVCPEAKPGKKIYFFDQISALTLLLRKERTNILCQKVQN